MQLSAPVTKKSSTSWSSRIDVVYGIIGFVVLAQFGASGAWKSFVVGWALAEMNFELIRRITTAMIALFRGEKVSNFLLYGMIVSKLSILGLIFLLISMANWLQAVPFMLGVAALIIAGLGYGVKELIYARTTRV